MNSLSRVEQLYFCGASGSTAAMGRPDMITPLSSRNHTTTRLGLNDYGAERRETSAAKAGTDHR